MRSIFFTILFFISYLNYSQINTPRTSPAAEISQIVGLTDIDVEYSRPSMRGREIFGNVVPFGKIWRTGADSSTKISFSTDVVIGDKKVNAGTYSVFSIPEKNNWSVIFYSDVELWGVPKDWSDEKIAFISTFKTSKTHSSVESFTISFNNMTNNDVDMTFSWSDVSVYLNIKVPTKKLVSDNIKEVMSGTPTASDYYASAVYYKQENVNLDLALEWINKAIEMFENPRFYQLRQQSLIMAANKKYLPAINVAKESLKLSIEADNKDYTKMNKESISEWSEKL